MSGTICAEMPRSLLLLPALAALALAATSTASTPTPIPGITSPSGNIKCLFVPPPPGGRSSELLCSIGHADYAAALEHRCASSPAGVDWHGFELSPTRRAAVTCSGGILYDPGTERPAYTTLAYGRSWRHGPFACVSRIAGLTCTSERGHGLFLSRGSWRVW
jgi:hypothetical protein